MNPRFGRWKKAVSTERKVDKKLYFQYILRMLQPKDVAIIIVSWNVRKPLQDCLESIFRLTQNEKPHQVIVVDNASTDGTVDMVRQQFPEVTMVANQTNVGFAAANNQGMRLSGAPAILLLNPDTLVHPGSLPAMVHAFVQHPKAGIIGPKLLNVDGTVQPSVRRLPSATALIAIALKIRHVWKNFPPLQRYLATDVDENAEQAVGQVMGAAFLIRRELMKAIGLLDERFYIWFEEVDYCKRAADAGWETWYVPNATITHLGGESFRQQSNLQKQRQWQKSVQRYAQKHFTYWQRLLVWKAGWLGMCLTWVALQFSKKLL